MVSHCTKKRRSREEVTFWCFLVTMASLSKFNCPEIFPELHRFVIRDTARVAFSLLERTFTLANVWFAFGAYKVVVDIKSSLGSSLRFKYMFPTGVRDLFH